MLNYFDQVELIKYCRPICPAAGIGPSTLHPLDWKTGMLWKSLWGESDRTTN